MDRGLWTSEILRAMDTINFTRGVPANESFPIDELIDASAAVSSRTAVRCCSTDRRAGSSRCASGSPSGSGSRPTA